MTNDKSRTKSERVKRSVWDDLEQGFRQGQIEDVQKFMKENFEDEYGQDRVGHVMEKLTEFPYLHDWFTERQIARLALTDVVDPSYKFEDKNRQNTHFEDAYQMAKFVDHNYDRLQEMGVGLTLHKEVLVYAFLNHDIGKAGESSSTVIAKFFNLKDEERLANQKGIAVDIPPRIGQVMRLLGLEKDDKNWQEVAAYINRPADTAEQLSQLPATRVYNKHETKLSDLEKSFKENIRSKWDEEGQSFLLNLIQSHHNDRNPQKLLDMKKVGSLDNSLFMDILDKSQAFFLRPPRKSLKETYSFMQRMLGDILPEIQAQYYKILKILFEADGDQVGDNCFMKAELERLEKER